MLRSSRTKGPGSATGAQEPTNAFFLIDQLDARSIHSRYVDESIPFFVSVESHDQNRLSFVRARWRSVLVFIPTVAALFEFVPPVPGMDLRFNAALRKYGVLHLNAVPSRGSRVGGPELRWPLARRIRDLPIRSTQPAVNAARRMMANRPTGRRCEDFTMLFVMLRYDFPVERRPRRLRRRLQFDPRTWRGVGLSGLQHLPDRFQLRRR
jgi:hypothetical protein